MAQQSGDTSQQSFGVRAGRLHLAISNRQPLDRRIIVASNRGPLHFTEDDSGLLMARRDSGHAAESLDPFNDQPVTWISGAVSAADRKAMETLSSDDGSLQNDVLSDSWDVQFVSPPRRVHHKFYNIICNPLLWFLLHRSWSPTFTPMIGAQEHDAWENGYRAVNAIFATEISRSAGDEPFVLINRDYQLMLVPGMVRKEHPNAVIRHSFETPWLWPSDLEILPSEWRHELLSSMLSADEISFPSRRDISAFIACVREFLGEHVEAEANDEKGTSISYDGRQTLLELSSPSVRSPQFESITNITPVQRFISDLTDDSYRHTFVTVDRAEPHKNLIRSINAFGDLLKLNPELSEDVRYLLFLTPGPAHVSAYKRLSEEVRRAARRVNEKAGDFQPVRVVIENNFYRAIAALSIYDTLVSVPVTDGTGRAAMDGAVVNASNGGMILSETNVAADILSDSTSLVGFADTKAITDAMAAAIAESTESRMANSKERLATLQRISSGIVVGELASKIATSISLVETSQD
jgi:trehalose 6-phosphate synthase